MRESIWQRPRCRDRNVVERCFSDLEQWRGIAMRSDRTARNDPAGVCSAAILQWAGSAPVPHSVRSIESLPQ